MEYIILVLAGVLAGFLPGWFIRHKFLTRQLNQVKKQMDEFRALQLNLEHEVSSARQKLLEQSSGHAVNKHSFEMHHSEIEDIQRKYDDAIKTWSGLKNENDELQDQIGYLETEKQSWLEYREKIQEDFQLLTQKNTDLEKKIDDLENKASLLEPIKNHYPEAVKRAYQEAVRSEKEKQLLPNNKDTQALKDPSDEKQVFDTDRVSGVHKNTAQGDSGAETTGSIRTTPKTTTTGNIAKPSTKRKKPKTVRVNRTTSEIIDNFKRDLGIPD